MKDGQVIVDEMTGIRYLLQELKDLNKKPRKRTVALVVGHTAANKGDYSKLFEEYEYDYWNYFADDLSDTYNIEYFLHNPHINSYTQRQKETAKLTAGYDLVIELHWNAFDPDKDGKDNASGSEALYWDGNYTTFDLACKFSELMKSYGFRDRGPKFASHGDRGAGFLKETKGDALLLEWFFGDSQEDYNLWTPEIGFEVLKDLIDYYDTIK